MHVNNIKFRLEVNSGEKRGKNGKGIFTQEI